MVGGAFPDEERIDGSLVWIPTHGRRNHFPTRVRRGFSSEVLRLSRSLGMHSCVRWLAHGHPTRAILHGYLHMFGGAFPDEEGFDGGLAELDDHDRGVAHGPCV